MVFRPFGLHNNVVTWPGGLRNIAFGIGENLKNGPKNRISFIDGPFVISKYIPIFSKYFGCRFNPIAVQIVQ